MTIKNTLAIINDNPKEGENPIEIQQTTEINNLDGTEAHQTAEDIVLAINSAISGYHPETGEPLPES